MSFWLVDFKGGSYVSIFWNFKVVGCMILQTWHIFILGCCFICLWGWRRDWDPWWWWSFHFVLRRNRGCGVIHPWWWWLILFLFWGWVGRREVMIHIVFRCFLWGRGRLIEGLGVVQECGGCWGCVRGLPLSFELYVYILSF